MNNRTKPQGLAHRRRLAELKGVVLDIKHRRSLKKRGLLAQVRAKTKRKPPAVPDTMIVSRRTTMAAPVQRPQSWTCYNSFMQQVGAGSYPFTCYQPNTGSTCVKCHAPRQT